jgi:hypothetical protein
MIFFLFLDIFRALAFNVHSRIRLGQCCRSGRFLNIGGFFFQDFVQVNMEEKFTSASLDIIGKAWPTTILKDAMKDDPSVLGAPINIHRP